MENKRLNTLLAAGCVAAFFAPLNVQAETVQVTDSTFPLNATTTNDYNITGSSDVSRGILNITPASAAVSLKGATLNGYSSVITGNDDYGIIFTDKIVVNALNNIVDFSGNRYVTVTNGITVNNNAGVEVKWAGTPESMGTLTLGNSATATFTKQGSSAIRLGATTLGQNANLNVNGTVQVDNLTSATGSSVNIGSGNRLKVNDSNSTISKLHMASTSSTLDLTNNAINQVTVNSMDSQGKLVLDFDFQNGTSDYVKTNSQTALNGSFDLDSTSQLITQATPGTKSVLFIKVADDNVVINSLPKSASIDNSYTIGLNDNPGYYISYNNDGVNFERNTIRLTNYNVYSDGVINALLLRGKRTTPTGNYVNHSYSQLPNMEASAALPGELTLYADNTGTNIEGENTALLSVDSSDGYSRTLNIEGSTLTNGDRSSDVNPTYNGAAIYVNKGAGTAIVNLRPNGANDANEVKFISNVAPKGVGGAIYNNGGTITSEKGSTNEAAGVVHFTTNSALNGGAIYNDAGSFTFGQGINATGNTASTGVGGFVYNKDIFKVTDGSSIISSNTAATSGGAIYNDNGTVSIAGTSTFSENTATANDGGAIYNNAGQVVVTGSSTFATNTAANSGGAIYNAGGNVELENASFNQNKATTASGGAIYNTAGGVSVAGNSTFTGNTAATSGGAIYNDNYTELADATTFTGNTAGEGGAIANSGTLVAASDLTLSSNQAGWGGAIANAGTMDLSGNTFYASGNNSSTVGGAIFNGNSGLLNIKSSNVTFENNTSNYYGGAVYNSGADLTIGTAGVTNTVFSSNSATNGGAIANEYANIDIVGSSQTFSGNGAGTAGGAVYNNNSTMNIGADSTETYFVGNTAGTAGGAVYNLNSTMNIGSEFSNIYFGANSAGNDGGAVYNEASVLNIGGASSTTTFENNSAGGFGGAIASVNNDLNLIGNQVFNANSAGNGGAIASNTSTVNMFGTQTFTNNTAAGRGGAIYMQGADAENRSVINLTSNIPGQNSVFSGNTDSTGANAIYMDGNATLNLTNENGTSFIFDDPIAGNANSNIINQNGNVYYNGNNSGFAGDFNLLSGGNAYFTAPASVPFQGGNYNLGANSTLHLMNGRIETINANSLTLPTAGSANITIDLDLTSETSDRFNLANSAVGNLLVTNMNITGDTDEDYVFFPIASGAQVSSLQNQVDTSYYTYDVIGGQTGLTLMKGDLSDTGLQAGQVAANAATLGQMALYNQLLFRVDEIAESRYFTSKNKPNLYAATTWEDHPTIDDTYTPYVNQQDGGCVWLKPSTTLETVSPSGFSGYKNRNWNAILGYETPISTLRSGFEIINTVFGGYQGSYQDFDDAYNYQNGGFGGYMANIYKKNFFMGFTALAGGIGVQTTDDGPYGRNQEFGLFNAGAAMRLGYNVGMGKHWLLQPIMTAGYTLISGYNEDNERGEGVAVKPTNTLQLAPGFKIIGNYNGWQPYALFDYTWALGSRTLAHVNDVTMPEMKVRSYVEYGVGVRKNMGERFTGYLEAVMRNGGRTGPSFQGGLTFKF